MKKKSNNPNVATAEKAPKVVRKRNRLKIISYDARIGLTFVLPFLIGFIFLYAGPVAESFRYTFHRITVGENGLMLEPVGWENYLFMKNQDPSFVKALSKTITDNLVQIPVMMFVSMFLAILLNDKFSGRLMFRAIMFLPVVFAADTVIRMMGRVNITTEMNETTNSFVNMNTEATGFVKEIIKSFGPLTETIEKFTAYSSKMYNLLWNLGIQIILFIIGLNTIPPYLYEVANMEGATKWETFWKITFPLLVPSMLLCLVYTIIDTFNATNTTVVQAIETSRGARMDYACAQSWVYAVIVLGFVLLSYVIVSRKIVSLD